MREGSLNHEPGAEVAPQHVAALIIENTEKVFSVMLGMTVKPLPMQVQMSVEGDGNHILSLLGFAGAWTGAGCVCCSSELACKMSGAMLMSEYESVNDEVLDALGEITNMVIGNFKDAAAPMVGQLALSTPTVIFGRNFRARNLNGQVWTAVPFECEGEVFEVKVCLVPTHEIAHGARPSLVVTGP
jgi:chemotaxis protein CheX